MWLKNLFLVGIAFAALQSNLAEACGSHGCSAAVVVVRRPVAPVVVSRSVVVVGAPAPYYPYPAPPPVAPVPVPYPTVYPTYPAYPYTAGYGSYATSAGGYGSLSYSGYPGYGGSLSISGYSPYFGSYGGSGAYNPATGTGYWNGQHVQGSFQRF